MMIGGLRPGKRAEHIDFEKLASRAQLEIHHRAVKRIDARVVDQYVEPTELVSNEVHDFGLVLWVLGFARNDHRAALWHRCDGPLQRLFATGRDAYARSLGNEALRDGETNASTRARDNGGLAGEW